ncbi:MAG TPA: helix-turn-helix domain-containing protein [Candidatus Bathyarchaeia archaeon]|nr:helix-turn-helix domain-containing protein [Candidatus Bathyarchaeia archaeon]
MPVRSSYELTRLFLSLSDESRLDILNQLHEQTSVIDICRRFGLLVHEAVRHIRRLEDVGLVYQLPNGDYLISEYGKVLVTFIEGISNVHDLLEYWERHSTTDLPRHLKTMPGDLGESLLQDSEALHATAAEIVREARIFLWVLNYAVDQTALNTREVKVLLKDADETTAQNVRYVDGISIILLVNELHGLIFFPRVPAQEGGQQDMSCGFLVPIADETYRLLAELFDFFWNCKSTPSIS